MKFAAATSSDAIAILSNSPSEALLSIAGLMSASQIAGASIAKLTEKEK